MSPKAVIFDLGKVLVDFDYGVAISRIQAASQIAHDPLRNLIDHSPLLCRYERGELTTEQFFNAIKTAAGFRGDLAGFSEMFGNIFTPIAPMVQLHSDLRARGLPTYIFSNTNELAVTDIRRRHAFFQSFNGYVLSYEHGAMKPDAKLYQVIERLTGLNGPDLVYLDDRPENIATGAARRWQVILHESPDKTRAAIERLGLLD